MQLTLLPRLGIGFDIEYNDTIIHIVGDEEEERFLATYEGLIIKLPFLSIYYGEFGEVDKSLID